MLSEVYNLFYRFLINGNEQKALDTLNTILDHNGKEEFLSKCPSIQLKERAPSKIMYTCSLLAYAASKGYFSIVEKLIQTGINLDHGVDHPSNKFKNNISPLMMACQYNHVEVANLLINAGANLLHVNTQGETILLTTNSLDIVKLIIEKARQNKCLNFLLSRSIKDEDETHDVFTIHCEQGNWEILRELMKVEDFHLLTSIPHLLRRARQASWDYPDKRQQFDDICQVLRTLKPRNPILTMKQINQHSYPKMDRYLRLFGRREIPLTSIYEETKKEAIKQIIVQFQDLLFSPDKCLIYLQFLNEELKRYYYQQHNSEFPVLDPKYYTVQSIEDLNYPIPEDDYVGLKKESALQCVLISIFRASKLANEAYKWIGFVPHEEADQHILDACFIKDGTMSNNLFHGKLSHMLQQLILIYAIEHGVIDLTFSFNGKRQRIELKEVIAAFIELHDVKYKQSVWAEVRDLRVSSFISFTDPHRLVSILMTEGRSFGCAELADYLTDEFCKGFNRFFTAYRQTIPNGSNLSKQEFLNQMDDFTLHIFTWQEELINIEIDHSLRHEHSSLVNRTKEYAVIRREYLPNKDFEPRTFQPDEALKHESATSASCSFR